MSLADLDRRVHIAIAAGIATIFFVVIAMAASTAPGFQTTGAGNAEDLGQLAESIFETNVLALEILGILLTAALIGAMVIARPLGSQPDTINYPTKQDSAGIERLQQASDVERNLAGGAFPTPGPLVPLLATDDEEEDDEQIADDNDVRVGDEEE